MPVKFPFYHTIPSHAIPDSASKEDLQRLVSSQTGTFPLFRPTHAHFHLSGKKVEWNSRDHRKGRHPLEPGQRRRISAIFRLEFWNISWWVAVLFTLGSAVWVINGFFVFLPSLNVTDLNLTITGWTAFVGGSLFEVGAYMMVLEALNRKHEVCFGDAVLGAMSYCSHHFHNRSVATVPDGSVEKHEQEWKWFGARWNEIGYVGSVIQMFAATVFWISTVTGIPGVIDMENVALTDGIYWVPQIIGGTGFIVASLLFLFETQPNWYHIRPFDSLGWHVGFWNLVGALGFTLCGAFGLASAQTWANYQSGCSTFWGGWAFLIGSICQWIECLNR